MRQSFSWWCFQNRGVNDDALLKGAKAIGYSGVELIAPDLYHKALENGLAIVSQSGHGTISDGLNNPTNHDRIEREIEANLELAVKYGIPNLIVFSGNRLVHGSDERGMADTVAGLNRVADAAESSGVTLMIELLNSKIDHKGYEADSMRWIGEVVSEVGSPNVNALYDIYHAQVMEGDIIRTIREQYGAIAHYHTAGNPGRNDLDDVQEINYPAIFRAIAETGYGGYIGHEFLPKHDPLVSLKLAFDLTEKALG